MTCQVLGLDIGGANLKAAHGQGVACTRPFPLWRDPGRLVEELRALLEAMPAHQRLAVTITAELCDCFPTKREGVRQILDAVEQAANGEVLIWSTDGLFLSPSQAREEPLRVAAANWLALATYAGRFAPTGNALLIDIGSTTIDLIPLQDGAPVPEGRIDLERLISGELVYIGVSRTPICAILTTLRYRGLAIRPAAELFATTQDAYVLLGGIPESEQDRNTADGRPLTRAFAHARLARMVCGDEESVSMADAVAMAVQVREAQEGILISALERIAAGRSFDHVILAGSGEFLARSAAERWGVPRTRMVSLGERLGPELSRAACAYALAVLAFERLEGNG